MPSISALTADLHPTGRVTAAKAAADTDASEGLAPAVRPMGGAQRRTVWREQKRQRTYSVTDGGWFINTALAETHGMNRSEVLEVLLRYAEREQLDLTAIRTALLAAPSPAANP